MRRILSLLLALAAILSCIFVSSCKDEKIPNREYDPKIVLERAADLVKKSALVNSIFWGVGIPVSEAEDAEKLGKYTEAQTDFLTQNNIQSLDDLKRLAGEVYDASFCEIIARTKLAAIQDSDGNMVSFVRYYQNTKKDESGNETKGPIMVHTEAEIYFDEDPIYHYDTLTILGVEGEIVHLQIEASFGEGGERIFVPVDLIEEASGWRLVSPTYVTNPKK